VDICRIGGKGLTLANREKSRKFIVTIGGVDDKLRNGWIVRVNSTYTRRKEFGNK
jgi:hypothetical protein